MADVAGEAVALDIGLPFPGGGVGVAGADIARLQSFELLLGAEFVGLELDGQFYGCWEVGRQEGRVDGPC